MWTFGFTHWAKLYKINLLNVTTIILKNIAKFEIEIYRKLGLSLTYFYTTFREHFK